LSSIVDGDGRVKAKLDDAEGVIVADVSLDPAMRGKQPLRRHGEMWAIPVPWYAFIWPMTQKPGERAYEQNTQRKERALSLGRAATDKVASN
jgi:N-carbamoylputrescine amidase